MAEVVLAARSSLVGRTLEETHFREGGMAVVGLPLNLLVLLITLVGLLVFWPVGG